MTLPLKKVRIDQILVNQGLAPSRERAQALILAGKVIVGDQRVEKSSEKFFPENIEIRLKGKDHPFVGRGGVKLAGALDHFKINTKDKTCLDVGASTGGFTDCLLQRGAGKVYTLDSGTNQLDFKLRKDPRVICQENFNARHLKKEDLPEPIDLVVVDVSFISLTKILPALVASIEAPWEALLLVKPQFELGPGLVEKGGIVRDDELRQKVLDEIQDFCHSLGLETQGRVPACLKGEKGNQEFFLWVKS